MDDVLYGDDTDSDFDADANDGFGALTGAINQLAFTNDLDFSGDGVDEDDPLKPMRPEQVSAEAALGKIPGHASKLKKKKYGYDNQTFLGDEEILLAAAVAAADEESDDDGTKKSRKKSKNTTTSVAIVGAGNSAVPIAAYNNYPPGQGQQFVGQQTLNAQGLVNHCQNGYPGQGFQHGGPGAPISPNAVGVHYPGNQVHQYPGSQMQYPGGSQIQCGGYTGQQQATQPLYQGQGQNQYSGIVAHQPTGQVTYSGTQGAYPGSGGPRAPGPVQGLPGQHPGVVGQPYPAGGISYNPSMNGGPMNQPLPQGGVRPVTPVASAATAPPAKLPPLFPEKKSRPMSARARRLGSAQRGKPNFDKTFKHLQPIPLGKTIDVSNGGNSNIIRMGLPGIPTGATHPEDDSATVESPRASAILKDEEKKKSLSNHSSEQSTDSQTTVKSQRGSINSQKMSTGSESSLKKSSIEEKNEDLLQTDEAIVPEIRQETNNEKKSKKKNRISPEASAEEEKCEENEEEQAVEKKQEEKEEN